MNSTQGQKYKAAFFFSGIAADIEPEMLDAKTGAFIESHAMSISNKVKNVLTKMNGDRAFVALAAKGNRSFIGAIWLNGYVAEFWRDTVAEETFIYANGVLIANNANLPQKYLDIDTNDETSELFITDNFTVPVVLPLQDMLDSIATTKYFADYDRVLYEVNRSIQLNQPVFIGMEDLGVGGGLKTGSYAYAIRYGNNNGERTNWGPVTPYIPVPDDIRSISYSESAPSINITGSAPSLESGKYGIKLRIRVTNSIGFDFAEIKRYRNVTGQPVSYSPSPEYIILTSADIKLDPYAVVDFIDSDNLNWATLDNSTTTVSYSTIKRARTIRYYDKRIVLGGVEYESHVLIDDDIFIQHSDVAKIAFPILKDLGATGFADIFNQVNFKSLRCGERYGFAAKMYDNQGNVLFSIPMVKGTESFKNFKFPNRRDIIPTDERPYSPDAQVISTVDSIDPLSATRTSPVYEVIGNSLLPKVRYIAPIINIVRDSGRYIPLAPTGRDVGTSNYGNSSIGLNQWVTDTVDGLSYNQGRFGTKKATIGLSIGGLDLTKLPSWISGFSVVRTPAAGRVVCQGIGMYALTPQAQWENNPFITKALNGLWFYSPEIDMTIGDKPSIFNDIKNNPSDYKIQLISPVGFFTDTNAANIAADRGSLLDEKLGNEIDMVSYAIMGGNDIHSMGPFDSSAQIGAGEGRATFGRWRNVYGTYNQVSMPVDLTFSISSASDVDVDAQNVRSTASRTPMLNIVLGSNIYAYNEIVGASGSLVTYDAAAARSFHEPWYIVNIIKEGKVIGDNNIDSYNDIGHYVKLRSLLGISNGTAHQTFQLVDERQEDVLTTVSGGYRYIYIDGKPWLGANNLAIGDINMYKAAIETTGSFTPSGGEECFGLYYLAVTDYVTSSVAEIQFNYTEPVFGDPICPESGDTVEIRYNNESPVSVFLGDTVIDDVICAPVDCEREYTGIDPTVGTIKFTGFRMCAPMPYRSFTFKSTYKLPFDPGGIMGSVGAPTFCDSGRYDMNYIRQWLVSFGCESSINIPFIYKDYFPSRYYVLRPVCWNDKLETETVAEYYERHGLYGEAYYTDYGDEYLNWRRGGFALPGGVNYDYQKLLHTKTFTKPKSGYSEITTYMKRLHWSSQAVPGYESSKSFLPGNIYDLKNDKASQISILYDAFSERGSNMYVITDRGVGLLMTNKNILSDAAGNMLGFIAAESTLVNGEIWLTNSIGCPNELWRGKSEGNIRLPNNLKTSALVFPTSNDIIIFSNDNFVGITTNDRKVMVEGLELADIVGDFTSDLYSVIDEGENNLWVRLGKRTFIFSNDINNWGGHINELIYAKSVYAPYLIGITDRNMLAHIVDDYINHVHGITVSCKQPDMVTIIENPYVLFSVTPDLGSVFQFTDMFISASHKPESVVVSLDIDFTSYATIPASSMREYATGYYYIQGIPKIGGRAVIGKTLFIKVTFADHVNFYSIKFIKLGYKEVTGS